MKLIKSNSLKKVLHYAKPYQKRFNWVIAWAILLSVFAAARPYLLKQTVDEYIKPKDHNGLLLYVILMAVVLLMLLPQFVYENEASWLFHRLLPTLSSC